MTTDSLSAGPSMTMDRKIVGQLGLVAIGALSWLVHGIVMLLSLGVPLALGAQVSESPGGTSSSTEVNALGFA
jgi:hypothetical protein